MSFEGKQQSLLTFRVGPVLCCAPSLPVRSIITPPKLTHTPGSDSSQPGIFKHGSHIVKVLDLRQKFGIEKDQHVHPGNLIITIFEKEGFAFWVDQIIDVFDFPSKGWGDLPPAIPRGVFTKTLLLNKKIHLYSEFEKLATISDLGYLKHYIQQLTQQEPDKDAIDVAKKTDISNKTRLDSKAETTKKEEKKPKSVSTTALSKPEKVSKQTSFTQQAIKSPAIPSSKVTKHHYVENKTPEKKPAINKPVAKTSVTTYKTRITPPHTPVTSAVSTTTSTTHSPQPTTIKHETNKSITKKIEHQTLKNNIVKENTSDINEDEGSSSFALIFFFLFLLGSLGAGLYFLFNEDEPTITEVKNAYTTVPSQLVEEFSPPDNTDVEDVIDIPNKDLQPEEIEKIKDEELVQENISPVTKAVQIENIKPVEKYRADIVKQENEITITLHQPINKEKTQELETQPIQELEKTQPINEEEINEADATIVPEPTIEILKPEVENKPIAEAKIVKEVIHIVVKGDTLWAIAKKYVNDPFLYPELARLSNIKNPHRIYPGNRVRIRFIKN